jgi:hypothetical protein
LAKNEMQTAIRLLQRLDFEFGLSTAAPTRALMGERRAPPWITLHLAQSSVRDDQMPLAAENKLASDKREMT